jgi:hypothetical protein
MTAPSNADYGRLTVVVPMPPRYWVSCSNCGTTAVDLSLKEAAIEQRDHRCPLPPNDGSEA